MLIYLLASAVVVVVAAAAVVKRRFLVIAPCKFVLASRKTNKPTFKRH